jgi:hypothetical protein
MSAQSKSITQDFAPQGHLTDETIPDLSSKRQFRRDTRNPSVMLCDPLDSPSSAPLPFHEDEMYGSDSDVETIILNPNSKGQARLSDEHTVCSLPTIPM